VFDSISGDISIVHERGERLAEDAAIDPVRSRMTLPGSEHAVVKLAKLRDYCWNQGVRPRVLSRADARRNSAAPPLTRSGLHSHSAWDNLV
jgi:hypothetical protein